MLFQGKDIDIEILQTRDPFLLPLKEETPKSQPKQTQKQKKQTNASKPNEASDEEVIEALKKYPKSIPAMLLLMI